MCLCRERCEILQYERFFRPGETVVMSTYAPITFPPAPVLVFQVTTCVYACLPVCMPACLLPACVPACLPACLPAYLPVCLPARTRNEYVCLLTVHATAYQLKPNAHGGLCCRSRLTVSTACWPLGAFSPWTRTGSSLNGPSCPAIHLRYFMRFLYSTVTVSALAHFLCCFALTPDPFPNLILRLLWNRRNQQ
jgi:hypothetical protein